MTWAKRRWPQGSGNKYGNRTATGLDGYKYHSALEAAVANLLLLGEKAGELLILKRQQHIHFYDGDVKLCEFWPDFTVKDLKSEEIYWVEAKGLSKPEFIIKQNIWRAGGPGRLERWEGDWRRPRLVETIYPALQNSRVRREQVFGKLEEA